jgi:hypothetical protein
VAAPRGYVVWEGKSRLNHDDIVCIVTLHSVNAKTGDMPQVWFLHQRYAPTTAVKTGQDEAICGHCAFRPVYAEGDKSEDAPCYVTLIHGPNGIWKAYKAGRYPKLPERYTFDRPIRIGSYGDPAAVPLRVLRNLVSRCDAGWTSYTHQWRRYRALKDMCMASVNNLDEQNRAEAMGWRTFRVQQSAEGSELRTVGLRREIMCPAGEHDGYKVGERTTCAKCRICDGAKDDDRRANIVVAAH